MRFVIMGEICMGPYNNYRRQASNAAKRQRVRAWEQTAAGAVVGAGKAAAAAALTPEEEVLSPLCCRTALALFCHRQVGAADKKREGLSYSLEVPKGLGYFSDGFISAS